MIALSEIFVIEGQQKNITFRKYKKKYQNCPLRRQMILLASFVAPLFEIVNVYCSKNCRKGRRKPNVASKTTWVLSEMLFIVKCMVATAETNSGLSLKVQKKYNLNKMEYGLNVPSLLSISQYSDGSPRIKKPD